MNELNGLKPDYITVDEATDADESAWALSRWDGNQWIDAVPKPCCKCGYFFFNHTDKKTESHPYFHNNLEMLEWEANGKS
jgi:hypothetical protein